MFRKLFFENLNKKRKKKSFVGWWLTNYVVWWGQIALECINALWRRSAGGKVSTLFDKRVHRLAHIQFEVPHLWLETTIIIKKWQSKTKVDLDYECDMWSRPCEPRVSPSQGSPIMALACEEPKLEKIPKYEGSPCT